MTIKELIEKLKDYPNDWDILLELDNTIDECINIYPIASGGGIIIGGTK